MTEEREVLLVLVVVFASLSAVASLFVFFAHFILRGQSFVGSQMEGRMALSLQACDFFVAVALIVSLWNKDRTVCFVQGLAIQLFATGSFMWTANFATYMTLLLRWRNRKRLLKLEAWFHAAAWGSTSLLSCIPLFGGMYGSAGTWCWVKQSDDDWLYRGVAEYFPILIVCVYVITAYIVVFRGLQNWLGAGARVSHETLRKRKQWLQRVILFPLVLVFVTVFGVIHRVFNEVSSESPPFWLDVCHIVTYSSTGMLNALAYAWAFGIAPLLKNRAKTVHGSWKKKPSQQANPLLSVHGDEG